MSMIRFADTTIRDGQQSLWANNMRTDMMLALAHDLDQAGFVSIETHYTHPKKVVRELKEDPWERLRLLRAAVTRTPLRAILARFRAFELSSPVLFEILAQCHARIGIQQARISDEWNQVHEWERKVSAVRDVGIVPVVNLIYSCSPKHTDEYYARRARQLARLDVFRICLKDPGGLLTPERVRTLVPKVLANAGDKEVELHSHCTTGLGPLNALEAVKLGIRTIHTGVPPLANGAALPDVFNMARNLGCLRYEPLFDEQACRRVSEALTKIGSTEGLPEGRPVEYELSQYEHQIPGGMASNLRHQLKLVGLEHMYDAALEECARVRREWGYPIMVTPLSQFVGSQAAVNVICGERYKDVTDQTIQYALGRWGGREAIEAMEPAVRNKILDRSRAKELAELEPPTASWREIRGLHGTPTMPDEEVLLRMEVWEGELSQIRAGGRPRSHEHLQAAQPLVTLIREFAGHKRPSVTRVRTGDLKMTLAKVSKEDRVR